MVMFYVVLTRTGPMWDGSLPMEQQTDWAAHARYMDDLVARGVMVLGGPLADERRVVLAVDADSEETVRDALAGDPWSGTHLVVDTVDRWTIRMDGRRAQPDPRSR